MSADVVHAVRVGIFVKFTGPTPGITRRPYLAPPPPRRQEGFRAESSCVESGVVRVNLSTGVRQALAAVPLNSHYYLQRLEYWKGRKPASSTERLLAARDADETHPLRTEEEATETALDSWRMPIAS
jgi:hypothetical protein